MSVTVYIALGGNVGNRRYFLDRALDELRRCPDIVVRRVSRYYDTEPVGGPAEQGRYLNAAAELQTDLGPAQLLQTLLAVELLLGRVRRERYGPRTIDLDLLLYGPLVQQDPDLTIPHPEMQRRRFVLEPLAELAPRLAHPVLGRSIGELLDQLPKGEGDARPGRALGGLRAMVTGSTSGIGRAIALALAEHGADVFVHGRRAPAAAQAVVEQVRAFGVHGQFFRADLRRPEECRQLVESAWDDRGAIDIWINNAGADTLTGAAAQWPFEQKLAELLAVDVTASMILARAVGQRMRQRQTGAIVNIGWDQAESGMEGDSGQLFAAVKGAVMAFTRSLALSLAPHVRVNCVAPGWIRTAWGESASSRWHDRVQKETPLARWGLPEDVAATVRWLVSPEASYITGQVIRINGGAVR